MTTYPNDQGQPTGATPVRLVSANGSAFYNAGGGSGIPAGATPLGYQQISAATLATAQKLTIPTGATFAIVQAVGGNLVWRDDGTAPTAAGVGMQLASGASLPVGGDLATIQFILATGQTGVLNASYYS